MAAAVPALMVAAAAVSAYASYETGRQQKKAADYNAQMADYNAKIALDAARAKEDAYSRDAARKLGAIRQQYAASGVEPTAGTPLTVLMESAQEAEKDKLRIRAGGEAESWAYRSEANLARMQGKSAYTQGTLGAGSSLLGGAARAGAYYTAKDLK